jgi:hypothetical protein
MAVVAIYTQLQGLSYSWLLRFADYYEELKSLIQREEGLYYYLHCYARCSIPEGPNKT